MRTRAIFLLVTSLGAAQSTRYNASHAWWEANQDEFFPWTSEYENSTGLLRISNPKGSFRTGDHPFFKALGSNGRACVTCHQPSNAMSLSVASVRERWETNGAKDPLFAAIDGSNCPTLPQSERSSHSLLLDRGLFRIGLAWPPKGVQPDFRLEVLRDPNGCNRNPGEISVYRRPRMTANLSTLIPGPEGAVLMADGREPTLRDQAITAARIHEEAREALTQQELSQILSFETQVAASQYADVRGGLLDQVRTPAEGIQGEFRASVVRGNALFQGRCASCHQPGTQRWRALKLAQLPDLPVFRIICDSGAVITTQDPGRALISGKCADVGAIVVPQFSGLVARAPYFSNGSAATLEELVDGYQQRLRITFTAQQKLDLVNYLSSL